MKVIFIEQEVGGTVSIFIGNLTLSLLQSDRTASSIVSWRKYSDHLLIFFFTMATHKEIKEGERKQCKDQFSCLK